MYTCIATHPCELRTLPRTIYKYSNITLRRLLKLSICRLYTKWLSELSKFKEKYQFNSLYLIKFIFNKNIFGF